MNIPVTPKKLRRSRLERPPGRPPFDCIALLLQGGGALGAYQGGVYQALAEAELHPDWVAGISIGAINAALIAGNPAESRVEKLRSFWETITANPLGGWTLQPPEDLAGDLARKWANRWFATAAAVCGAPGLFGPRMLHPLLQPTGTPDATSFYDTSALKTTLERLVDFDRINAGEMRFSVGAVNVPTGNFVYFDNSTHLIRPEHIMASGALPPGFPAIEIEGEHYWDGGLVSNTPLQWVLESAKRQDTLAFQVDLWSARGAVPRTLGEVATRQKEIQYSSRTRASSDQFKKEQKLRNALADLISKLPDRLRETPEFALLNPEAGRKVYNIVQLIYRSKQYEGESKDFEFSALSMVDHWTAGLNDTVRTLRHPEVLERPSSADGVFAFDLAAHGRV
ncbi:MAG TPA: patatin-like phospholipase family protein [Xanthobacteraceae bacterium]|nr:patatin-like phospholipase family protein [Xanthobacteraceae bacterium]